MMKAALSLSALVMLVALLPAAAGAQECTGGEFDSPIYTAASAQGETGSGWINNVGKRMRHGGTLDFYLKVPSAATETLFISGTQLEGGIDFPPVGIRTNANKFEFLYYSNPIAQVYGENWGCGTRNGTGLGNTALTPSTCPTAVADTWYHFRVTFEAYSRLVDYEIAPCDGAFTKHAENFGTHQFSYGSLYTIGVQPYLDEWKIVNEFHPNDMAVANMTWTRQDSPQLSNCSEGMISTPLSQTQWLADVNGLPFTPCSTVLPTDVCGGQTDITPVDGFKTPNPGGYATVSLSGCRGAVVGPHTVVTAEHCVDAPEDGRQHVMLLANSTQYPVYLWKFAPTLLDGNDIAIGFTRPDVVIPPPYVNLYDYTDAAQLAACEKFVSVGLGECDAYAMQTRYDGIGPVVPNGHHDFNCYNGMSTAHEGGWSGGPLYAIGNFGDAQNYRLYGPHQGGLATFHNNYMLDPDYSTWVTDSLATIPPIVALPDGLALADVEVETIGNTDLGTGTGTARCHVRVTNTGAPPAYGGCTIVGLKLHSGPFYGRRSCHSTQLVNGEFTCDIEIPRLATDTGAPHTSNGWYLAEAFTGIAGGASRVVSEKKLDINGSTEPLNRIPFTNSGSQITGYPTVTSAAISPTPLGPGGRAATFSAAAYPTTITDHVTLQSVVLGSGTYAGTQLIPSSGEYVWGARANRQGFWSFPLIPFDAQPTDTWFIERSTIKTSFQSMEFLEGPIGSTTTLDCINNTADTTVNGTGWEAPPTSVGVVRGYDSIAEFWARVGVNDANAVVGFAETAINGDGDIQAGVRFGANGRIEVLDNGSWVFDRAYTYQPNVWYKFTLIFQFATAPIGSAQPAYKVLIEKCGSDRFEVKASALANGGSRMFTGMTEHNFKAEATQTLEVSDLSMTTHTCGVTVCIAEGWECGSPPNGCGGTPPTGGGLGCDGCGGGTPNCNLTTYTCEP